MTTARLQELLDAIHALPGVHGCAMVDAETGMAWKTSGGEAIQILCEAASDHWRLQMRNTRYYAPLGDGAAQILVHTRARITVVGCAGTLLLVCVSGEPDGVDWSRWKVLVGDLRVLAASI